MSKQTAENTQINLPPDVLIKARGRAHALGMTLSEYVKALVDKDIKTKEHDPWREPVPPEVDAIWEKDLAETEEEERRTGQPRKTYYSAEEYIKDIQETP